MSIKLIRCLAFACAVMSAAPALHAQIGAVGGKPVSLVVSYPVGGGADLMARLIAPRWA